MRKFTVTFDTPLCVALYVVVSASSFDDAVDRATDILQQDLHDSSGYSPVEVTLHLGSDSISESHATTKRPRKKKRKTLAE